MSDEPPAPTRPLVLPQASFAPQDVVRLQLEALADGDEGWGILQCFQFASPRNRQFTGPVSRFSAMLHRPPYDVMFQQRAALIGRARIAGDRAQVLVSMVDGHDELRVFRFLLSRQSQHPYLDCWMTDGVAQIVGTSVPVRLAGWQQEGERG